MLQSPPVKSFYLPRSALAAVASLPSQLLFALLGMLGLAHYSRQIVRVRPRVPGSVVLSASAAGVRGEEKAANVDRWISESVPSLNGTFIPSWWLPNGHLQTFFIVAGNFNGIEKIDYVRTQIRVPDGGTLSLDMAPANHEDLPADAPTIVFGHGLTGSAQESYVRNIARWVTKTKEQGGLGGRAVVVDFRGCGGTPITSPQFYSAAASSDLHTAVHYIRSRFPSSAMHGIGFSLGASVLARYLGERGDQSLLSSGCVIGCPWDIVAMSHALEDGWLSSRIYSRALGQNLLRLFFKHYELNPEIFEAEGSRLKAAVPEMKRLRALRHGVRLKMVDDAFVVKAGGPDPPFRFNSADEYYEYAGSHQVVHNVKVPTLGLNAMDDPVVHGDALPINQIVNSSHVHLAVTGGGGHLGWFDGPLFGRNKQRWILKPVSEFLTAAARDLGPTAASLAFETTTDGASLGPDEESHGEGWTWVKGDKVSPQTGALPARVGWKVLCVNEPTSAEGSENLVQGL